MVIVATSGRCMEFEIEGHAVGGFTHPGDPGRKRIGLVKVVSKGEVMGTDANVRIFRADRFGDVQGTLPLMGVNRMGINYLNRRKILTTRELGDGQGTGMSKHSALVFAGNGFGIAQ